MDKSVRNSNAPDPSIEPRQRPPADRKLRCWLYDVIFESETPAGKTFDVLLLIAILASITVVSLETVESFSNNVTSFRILAGLEIVFTIGFGVEFLLRCYCVRSTTRYIFSFWGIVDLLSFLPSALAGLGPVGIRSFVILRSLRLLRVFRILKLWRMMSEAQTLSDAVWQARDKIIVFLIVVLIAVTISGTLMYHVEQQGDFDLFSAFSSLETDGEFEREREDQPNKTLSPTVNEKSDFTSIPQSMYWAIVTMTTVGYGDIAPRTTIGKCIAAILILLGYSLIIVPTGFVSAEIGKTSSENRSGIQTTETKMNEPPSEQLLCNACKENTHFDHAIFCHRCGTRLKLQ